jgi:hypothetical protein
MFNEPCEKLHRGMALLILSDIRCDGIAASSQAGTSSLSTVDFSAIEASRTFVRELSEMTVRWQYRSKSEGNIKPE